MKKPDRSTGPMVHHDTEVYQIHLAIVVLVGTGIFRPPPIKQDGKIRDIDALVAVQVRARASAFADLPADIKAYRPAEAALDDIAADFHLKKGFGGVIILFQGRSVKNQLPIAALLARGFFHEFLLGINMHED